MSRMSGWIHLYTHTITKTVEPRSKVTMDAAQTHALLSVQRIHSPDRRLQRAFDAVAFAQPTMMMGTRGLLTVVATARSRIHAAVPWDMHCMHFDRTRARALIHQDRAQQKPPPSIDPTKLSILRGRRPAGKMCSAARTRAKILMCGVLAVGNHAITAPTSS